MLILICAGCATTDLATWSSCVPSDGAASKAKVEELKEKLVAASMPEVDFRNAKLVDVFEFLSICSEPFDREDHDYVPFILLGKGTQKKTVTLAMRNTTVFDAFTTVCDMCCLSYVLDPRGVVFIMPKQPTQVEFHDDIKATFSDDTPEDPF